MPSSKTAPHWLYVDTMTRVRTTKQTAQITNSVLATPTDIPGLAFHVDVDHRYWFRFLVTFQTAATTTGIAFTMNLSPAMTAAAWRADIQQAVGGTDAFYSIGLQTFAGSIVSTGVVAANTDYMAIIEGFCIPSAAGTLQLRARTEVDASQITVQNVGVGFLIDAG